MAKNFISSVSIQFEYFDRQLSNPQWKGKRVLDFGGNVGNILMDPRCTIDQENYWCLDVSKDAILEGQKRYPKADFRFYDAYNLSFNPTGVEDLPIPEFEVQFDYILAYSIFTHTDEAEMINKVDQLIQMLSDNGVLIFTFLVADYNGNQFYEGYKNITNFEKRLRKLNGGYLNENLYSRHLDADSMILVNSGDLYINGEAYAHLPREEGDTIFTYYTPEYLKSLFRCTIKNPPSRPYDTDYPAEMQHACIIKRQDYI